MRVTELLVSPRETRALDLHLRVFKRKVRHSAQVQFGNWICSLQMMQRMTVLTAFWMVQRLGSGCFKDCVMERERDRERRW